MLRIRLQRFGTKNEPTYRLVVAEQSIRRDGRFVEVLGNYNPAARGKANPLSINVERVDHWIKLGAQPSDTAKSLVKRARAAAPGTAPCRTRTMPPITSCARCTACSPGSARSR
mgnify:CR=1 FL=1